MSIIDKFKKKLSDAEEVKDIEETKIVEETEKSEEEKAAEKTEKSEEEKAAEETEKSEEEKTVEETEKSEEEKVAEETKKSEEEKTSESEVAATEEPKEKKKKEKKKKKKKVKKEEQRPEDVNIVKELLSLIIYIGIVVLLCYFIINFVGCRSRVDGDSMEPTLSDGNNLWVDKLSYTFGEPERFDVIIFNYDEDTTYVKRIIGLPGETVRIDQNGNIFITGESGKEQLLKENYGNEKIKPNYLGRANQPVYLNEDEYFVLGDNRNNSRDSRWADVGNVKMEDIVGKVVLRIYPLTEIGVVK